jgi:hypothetical protein
LGFSRARIVLLAVLATLVGASVAFASHAGGPDPALTLATTQAASGEEVGFTISNTEAYSTYTIIVDSNNVVARGTDPEGDGETDKFKMPDLGSSEKSVTVEAQVKMPSAPPDTVFSGTQTMQYVLFPTTTTGPTSDTQPQPVPLAATPASQVTPVPAGTTTTPKSPSSTDNTSRTKHRTRHTTSNQDHSSNQTGGSGNSNSNSQSTTTPANSGGSTQAISRNTSIPTSRNPSAPTSQKPSGPVGAAGLQPPSGPPGGGLGGSLPTTTLPAGTAHITGSGGFPTALLVALALLALAAIAVGLTRMRNIDWRGFRFAFVGPHDADELRIGALSRAARSGAEAQEAIAVRKASRRAG